jgi:hypothetical protein
VLVLEIRVLWVARDEDEHEDDDEVLALQPRMELHQNNIGFSKFHLRDMNAKKEVLYYKQ